MNTVSLMEYKERVQLRPDKINALCREICSRNDTALLAAHHMVPANVEVKIPLDVVHFLRRASSLVKDEKIDMARTSEWQSFREKPAPGSESDATHLSPFSLPASDMTEMLKDIKKISYRLGWLDGHDDLRKKFISNFKQHYGKKEEEREKKVLALSHLLNCKNSQVSALLLEKKRAFEELSSLRQENIEHLDTIAHFSRRQEELSEMLDAGYAREMRITGILEKTQLEFTDTQECLAKTRKALQDAIEYLKKLQKVHMTAKESIEAGKKREDSLERRLAESRASLILAVVHKDKKWWEFWK
jgi:hypothetical protein